MNIQPDNMAAVDFLRTWAPLGPWVVTAIHPDTKRINTATFDPSNIAELGRWLAEFNGNRNLYFEVNPPIRPLNKKAERRDIKELAWLHVDIDPRVGEDLASERLRCRALFMNKLPDGVPPPTALIFSGGGYQAFWRLADPFHIGGDLELAEQAKLWNLQLERIFGGDHCHNVDRIMRLPGTVNLPDERKRIKGREAALAQLISFDPQHVYHLSQFAPAEAASPTTVAVRLAEVDTNAARLDRVSDLDQWKVPDRIKVIIVNGQHPDEPKPAGKDNSRSGWLFDVTCNLVRCGVPNEIIYSVITDPKWKISESVLGQQHAAEKYAKRQIANAHQKVLLDEAEFQVGESNKVLSNQHNIRLALHKLGVSVRRDIFRDKLLIDGLLGQGPRLDEAAVVRLWLLIEERFGFRPNKDFFIDVVADAARATPFHPVHDYLHALSWDEQPRLDNWLSVYGGAEDNEYTRAVGALLLVAAVRRVKRPGCKFDEMVVLESSQGTNKSSALRIMAVEDDWFTDDLPLNVESKVVIERLAGRWIAEAAELKGMRNGQVEHLKAFLSRQSDSARLAYARLVVEVPRQCVIVGTTNSDQYLRDGTGNRRFWPVRIAGFDLEALRRDRDQLWAEAAKREASGVSIRLDPALWACAAEHQEARKVDDPFAETFGAVLRGLEGKIKAEDAWSILGIPTGHRTQELNARLGEAMRSLGWKRKKLRFGGTNPEWAYVRGNDKHPKRIIVRSNTDVGIDAFCEGEPVPF